MKIIGAKRRDSTEGLRKADFEGAGLLTCFWSSKMAVLTLLAFFVSLSLTGGSSLEGWS